MDHYQNYDEQTNFQKKKKNNKKKTTIVSLNHES